MGVDQDKEDGIFRADQKRATIALTQQWEQARQQRMIDVDMDMAVDNR